MQFTNENQIFCLLALPKPKPKLGSFRKYYTRSLETAPSRLFSSPQKTKKIIDDFLVDKIQKLAPSKINKQFKKHQSTCQRFRTEKSENKTLQSKKYSSIIEKFRERSLKLSREAAMSEYRVKKKAGKIVKKEFSFDIRNIEWTEQKWGSASKRGKYSEKLHPICLIYEQQVTSVLKDKEDLPNPFEGYQHIQFL